MGNKQKSKYRGVSNLGLSRAMHGFNSSSAASPQESRNKRARTKQTVLRRELRLAY